MSDFNGRNTLKRLQQPEYPLIFTLKTIINPNQKYTPQELIKKNLQDIYDIHLDIIVSKKFIEFFNDLQEALDNEIISSEKKLSAPEIKTDNDMITELKRTQQHYKSCKKELYNPLKKLKDKIFKLHWQLAATVYNPQTELLRKMLVEGAAGLCGDILRGNESDEKHQLYTDMNSVLGLLNQTFEVDATCPSDGGT